MDERFPDHCHIKAWRPTVPGVAEVFHAELVDFAYPPHCHDTWTVLIVESGAIRYDLDRRHCGAVGQAVAILPPGVIHDGRPGRGLRGFRKRNLYLDAGFLPEELVGPAVDHTTIDDADLRSRIAAVHDSIVAGEHPLDAETLLVEISDRIGAHLDRRQRRTEPHDRRLAVRLRELLDAHMVEPLTLGDAAATLDCTRGHLIRVFRREYGVSPHAYVIGRRIDRARRALLAGSPPAEVAVAVGFYDQAHLTRHFKRHTAVTPARFARSAA